MGFEQVFDNLTFKHIDALRKQIQSLGHMQCQANFDIDHKD